MSLVDRFTSGSRVEAGSTVLTGEVRSRIDRIWNDFWSGGISNPLDATTYSASQIEFVNLIIDDLTEHGVIEARRFYESPFTDVSPLGPEGLFSAGEVDRLVAAARTVRDHAAVA